MHREDLGGAAFVGHGWYSAVRDLARAALLLDDAHLDRVASPLRRSMAEHALALRWLLDRPEAALESLRLAQQLTVGRIQTAIAGGSWNIPDGVFDSLLNPPAGGSSEDVNLHFANLAREFGQRDLLAAWLHESATCHPSLASASRYTWTWPGAELTLTTRSKDASGGKYEDGEVVVPSFALGKPGGAGYWSGSNLILYRRGEGRVVLSTLRLLENLGKHPPADRIVLNLIALEQ